MVGKHSFVPPKPIKVVYVAGLGRSGSTLLGALLGQLDGFFYAGELVQTGRYVLEEGLCGCGEPLAACPVWRAIFAAAFPETAGVPDPSRLGMSPREARASGALRERLRAHLVPASSGADRTRGAFGAVLRAISQTTGSRVIVDSSKLPGYGTLLEALDSIELFVVHLVRDPRAVVHSRLRTAERIGAPLRPGPRASMFVWASWNPTIELLWRRRRYLRLRYEDLVGDPQDAVDRIAAFVGEPPAVLPFASKQSVDFAPTHTVAGNRSRFQTGTVRIRLDDEWITAERFSRLDRLLVTAVTWPLRARYGYR